LKKGKGRKTQESEALQNMGQTDEKLETIPEIQENEDRNLQFDGIPGTGSVFARCDGAYENDRKR
jgi:hypothetical protein